jgi:arsenate reductase (thioredoxin)
VREEAITVMREIGVDISTHRPKGIPEALGPDVALVVGLCAEEACPTLPGIPSLHWALPNPRPGDVEDFRRTRDDLRDRIARMAPDLARRM